MLDALRRLLELAYDKLAEFLLAAGAPPGSLPLTGVLGLAALLLGYWHLRRSSSTSGGGDRAGVSSPAGQSRGGVGRLGGAAAGASSSAAATKAGASSSGAGACTAAAGSEPTEPGAAASGLARAVRARLGGARRVTLSALGTLLQEAAPAELSDGASLHPSAARLLSALCWAASDVYIIAHVSDDVGAAAVAGALDAAGALGHDRGQLPRNRLLFCSTLEGKVALVRQIEPDLHVDAASRTVDDLARFAPRLLHIVAPGSAMPTGRSAAHIVAAPSLAAFFGVGVSEP